MHDLPFEGGCPPPRHAGVKGGAGVSTADLDRGASHQLIDEINKIADGDKTGKIGRVGIGDEGPTHVSASAETGIDRLLIEVRHREA